MVEIKDTFGLMRLLETPKYKLKATGDARTNPVLVNEILDQIPKSVWRKGGSFLDPCCGRGTFLLAIIERLRPYHAPNEIIKMIYGVDIDSWNVYTTKQLISNTLGISVEVVAEQIQQYDFLRWDPKLKQFDAVVGNPPYQKPDAKTSGGGHTLWKQISTHAFDLIKPDGYIAFVTPAVPYYNKNELGRRFREWQTTAVCSDASQHFPGVGSTFTYWIVQNTPKYKLTRIVDLGYDIDLASIPPNRRKFIPQIAAGILDKIDAAKLKYGVHNVTDDNSNLGNKDNTVERPSPDYPYPVRWGSIERFRYAKIKTYCYDKNRVMCTFSGNPAWEYFDSTNGASSVAAMSGYLLVDNADQGARFIAQVDLNINRFERQMIKGSGAFTSPQFWQSIKFDLNRDISDADAYQTVGLTPNEIAYIESTIK